MLKKLIAFGLWVVISVSAAAAAHAGGIQYGNPSLVDDSSLYNNYTVPRGLYDISTQVPYGISQQEQVSGSTGELTIRETDLVLPGRNGLSLDITRVYSNGEAMLNKPKATAVLHNESKNVLRVDAWLAPFACTTSVYSASSCTALEAITEHHAWAEAPNHTAVYDYYDSRDDWYYYYPEVGIYEVYHWFTNAPYPWTWNYQIYHYQNDTEPLTHYEKKYNLGAGWRFAFPSMEIASGNKMLHLPDGSVYRINGSNQLEDYPFNDLTFANTSDSFAGQGASYKLTDSSGTIQYFNSEGNWLGTKDAYANEIKVYYASRSIFGGSNANIIDHITDSVGRNIQFTYTATTVTVAYDSKSIIYTKTAIPTLTNEMNLTSVTNEEGKITSYAYDTQVSSFDFESNDATYPINSIRTSNLKQVTYPTGAKTVYVYGTGTKKMGNDGQTGYSFIQSRYDEVNTTKQNMLEYKYDTVNHFSGYPNYAPDALPTNYTYKNEVYQISNPNAAAPKPYSLKTEQTFNYKHLNTVTSAKKELQYRKDVTQTYNLTYKLPEKITTTVFNPENEAVSDSKEENYTYNAAGRVLTYKNPKNYETTYTYSTNFPSMMTSAQTKFNNIVVEHVEQSISNTKPEVDWGKRHYKDENGQSQYVYTDFSYDSYGNVTRIISPNGDGTTSDIVVEYGAAYQYAFPTTVKSKVKDNGVETTIEEQLEYNLGTGRLTEYYDGKTVQAGLTTVDHAYSYGYDVMGRATGIIYPLVTGEGQRATKSAVYAIDAPNQQMSVETTDEEGKKTKQIYDGLGRLVQEQLPDELGVLRPVKTLEYNVLGQLKKETDGLNRETEYNYDAIGRVTRETFDDGDYVETTYDDVNRKVTVRDERDNLTVTYTDTLGRTLKTEQVDKQATPNVTLQSTTEYEYTNNPFLQRVVDGKANPSLFKYNGLQALEEVTEWVNGVAEVTKYRYNQKGNMTEKIAANNAITSYRYDELGRLIAREDPSSNSETYRYDRNQQQIEKKDRNGIIQTFAYDQRNRLTGTVKGAIAHSFTYYKNNLRKTMTDATGDTSYTYWPDLSTKKITFPDLKTIEYAYDDVGNLEWMKGPFSDEIHYKYESRNQLDYITIGNSSTREIDYTYANGRLSEALRANGVKSLYTYDGFNRLTGLKHQDAASATLNNFEYDYDNNGNILSREENGTTRTFAYDELDRIEVEGQDDVVYAYDPSGNRMVMHSTTGVVDTLSQTEYKYDEFNRLTMVKSGGSVMVENTYNGDGQLVEQTRNGVTVRYYYDGPNIIAEGTVDTNGNVTLQAKYVRAGDELISRTDQTGIGYYQHNGHGDVVELRSAVGAPLANYTYDIWGNPLIVNETGMTNPFRYSGELWDSSTNLQYLRARWYDPSVGRFITEDTYEGQIDNPLSLNLYTYVENNPLIYTDPSGHKKHDPWFLNGSGGGGGSGGRGGLSGKNYGNGGSNTTGSAPKTTKPATTTNSKTGSTSSAPKADAEISITPQQLLNIKHANFKTRFPELDKLVERDIKLGFGKKRHLTDDEKTKAYEFLDDLWSIKFNDLKGSAKAFERFNDEYKGRLHPRRDGYMSLDLSSVMRLLYRFTTDGKVEWKVIQNH